MWGTALTTAGRKMRERVKPKNHVQEVIYSEDAQMSGRPLVLCSACDKKGESPEMSTRTISPCLFILAYTGK